MKARLLLVLVVAGLAASAPAQVSVLERTSPDGAYASTAIHIDTMDRTVVPLRTETTQKPLANGGTLTETVVQSRLATGAYFTSERATTTTQPLSGGSTRSVTEVATIDRQGQARPTRRVVETTTKHGDTETTQTLETRRDASGALVPRRQIAETSQRKPDGTVVSQREVQEPDVSGQLVLTRKINETVVTKGPNEKLTEARVYTPNHLTGELAETGRETTVVRADGDATQTERLISQPNGVNWEVKTKVVTTETKSANGSLQRETVQYAKPIHDAFNPTSVEPLQPKLKIVEKAVTGADGQSVMEREVYFRDVNNQWKAKSFSTDFGGSGERNYGR